MGEWNRLVCESWPTTGAVDRLKKKKNKKMTKMRFSQFLYTKRTGVVGDSGIVFR